ncbi:hypothetical protein AB0J80_12415 [Actinoplanes sp. NPDC049548]|uniref:hypothetical protein n=1 Tax=Actinoplanes sp. NPDC049548 TaxID=3155152 RepID=UPI0034341C56
MTLAAARSAVPVRSRSDVWLLVVAQYGYAAWFAVCVYLALARAAQLAGHWYVPAANDAFTGNADIMAGWAWASPVTTTLSSAWMVLPVALIASAVSFLFGYTSGRRALSVALIGSTIAMLLTAVAASTPVIHSISGWLID